jgi:hypothetical protein
MEYANIAGAICASRFGTISALATKEELEIQLLNFQKRHLNIQGNPQLYRD